MALLTPLPPPSRTIDLLIIGGGIVGAGIARDASLRGASVVLVEQGDFAGGTSSQTSKLIHGGLRYLEHAHFRLVFESLRERAVLLRAAPHLVRPLPFLIPNYQGDARGRALIHAGLSLYDALGCFGPLSRHRCHDRAAVLRLEPALAPEGLRGGATYLDAQMQDARLCLENVLEAQAHGAICRNYCRLVEFTRADGRLTGAVVEDRWSQQRYTVSARAIVNATGPWADRVRQLSDPAAMPRLRPSKGIHLVTRRLTQERALLISARRDGRVFFILPWERHTLIGTTDTDTDELPEAARATAEEVAYLLTEVNRVLPQARVGPADVLATFAGLRPLVAGPGQLASVSREHVIDIDAHGLISVLGGKFTTYRRMAEETVNLIVRRRRLRPTSGCITARQPFFGQDAAASPRVLRQRQEEWRAVRGLSPASLAHLIGTYGLRAERLVALIAADETLGAPLCAHHPHVRAELIHAVEREHARTISDFCCRRTHLAYSACHALEALPAMTELLTQRLGWPAAQAAESAAAYQDDVRSMLACVAP